MHVDVMALIKELLLEEYNEAEIDDLLKKSTHKIEGDKITITYESGAVETFKLSLRSISLTNPPKIKKTC